MQNYDPKRVVVTFKGVRLTGYMSGTFVSVERDRVKKTSKFKGVCWDTRGKWRARITQSKKNKHLGYFTDEIEAAKAYNKAALKHFGEFAYLNEVG
jgi:hypothetical protein